MALLFLVIGGNLLLRSPRHLLPPQAPGQVLVEFRLNHPSAREVALAGEFTEWKPLYALKRSASGVWTILVPLDPGVHNYSFVVDGDRWVPDPDALPVDDGFGGQNSRVAVVTPNLLRKL
jgi:1,4-alpha-glucan branching enzyme